MRDATGTPSGCAALTPEAADTASRNASAALALALPGDTLLYLLLPLHAAAFGVSLPEAGVLLAANRLIRIVGYGWVARLYAGRGPRALCLGAGLGAVASTLAYGTLSGLWPLLIARLAWGLSFASLNIANQALATLVSEGALRRTGRMRMLVATGPTAALVAGGVASLWLGPRLVFVVLAMIAAPALAFAWRLPAFQEPMRGERPRLSRPGPLDAWSFAMGFTLDGLFIFGLGLLVAARYPREAVVATGLAMSLRYVTEVVLSGLGARLAQYVGALRVLIIMSVGAASALALLAGSGAALWIGAGGAIVLRALAQALAAPVIAEAHPGEARIPALARQATWRDVGAGLGPLAAGVLLPVAPAAAVYGGAALLLGATSLLLVRELR